MDRETARALHREARAAWEAEDWLRSAQAYERLVRAVPDGPRSAVWWYNAALAYKFLGDWRKAYELGRQAAARSSRGEEDPAFWNLGIAATVLREWATARDAWLGYGVQIPPGDGPINENLGMTCVRIDAGGGQEVVWAQRLCPTRARVLSVPFDPGRRFGEVVLHDGAPNGERVFGESTFPVFDELLLFESSELATLAVTVTAATADDVESLRELFFERHDFGFEALSSARALCRCCSEGTVTQEREVRAGEQKLLLAAPLDEAGRLLDEWRAESPPSRSWTNLHLAT